MQRQRLKAEADALSSIFANSDADMWPPLIDSLTVAPGYETALAARSGDDLQASTDLGAPSHWRQGDTDANAPGLPASAEPLSRFVTGSVALGRRLAQIGVVEDEAACRALAAAATGPAPRLQGRRHVALGRLHHRRRHGNRRRHAAEAAQPPARAG